MRAIELTPRLKAVAELVPQGANFADIGTDHARLPIYLLQRNIVTQVIVSDLRQGPLDRAYHNALRYGLMDQFSFCLCNGLEQIPPGEASVIAIAGMGGETIAAILEAAPWTAQQEGLRLLLQPMSAISNLRYFLQNHHYRIDQEVLCKEGNTMYTVLSTQPGDMEPLTLAELWAGRVLNSQQPVLRGELLDHLCCRAERALSGIRNSIRPTDFQRREDFKVLCAQLQMMREEWALCQI